ncbi:MAG: hypothetical protein A2W26_00595 [Acidobacteria bacterium RBG_16_64_8]|nr:MAG: hypothetical protein A2W26_00595 [Acidobacteria bacterium RBG_16_64_8]
MKSQNLVQGFRIICEYKIGPCGFDPADATRKDGVVTLLAGIRVEPHPDIRPPCVCGELPFNFDYGTFGSIKSPRPLDFGTIKATDKHAHRSAAHSIASA